MASLGLSLPSPGQLLDPKSLQTALPKHNPKQNPKFDQKCDQNGSQNWQGLAQESGQERPRRGHEPKRVRTMPQQPPREPQQSPKRAQRELQESRKRAQESPREPQESPTWPEEPQEDHKKATREPARANLQASSPPVASAGVAKHLKSYIYVILESAIITQHQTSWRYIMCSQASVLLDSIKV